MELDKRIKEGKRPLTCFDLKEAEQFIGEDGYFAHEKEVFENLDRCYFSRLLGFDTCDKSIPFAAANASRDYEFFIPEDWVKKPEKKYRPYSLEEFFKIFKVGDLIVFRMKIFDEIRCAMFTGYMTDGFRIDDKTPGACDVMLGASKYSLFSLFENFELFYNGEWQPFGIEVEEK